MLRIKAKILNPTKSPIWRKIEVPDRITLYELHLVLAISFGWPGNKEFCFRLNPSVVSTSVHLLSRDFPMLDDEMFIDSVPTLAAIYIFTGDVEYMYDTESEWQVLLEEVEQIREDIDYPELVRHSGPNLYPEIENPEMLLEYKKQNPGQNFSKADTNDELYELFADADILAPFTVYPETLKEFDFDDIMARADINREANEYIETLLEQMEGASDIEKASMRNYMREHVKQMLYNEEEYDYNPLVGFDDDDDDDDDDSGADILPFEDLKRPKK